MSDGQWRARASLLTLAGTVLLGLALVAGFVWLGPGRWLGQEPSAMDAGAQQASVPYVQPTSMSTQLTTSAKAPAAGSASYSGGAPELTESEALVRLTELVAHGTDALKFQGQWAAQLASKYVGIIDPTAVNRAGTHTFDAADIWAEHQALAQLVDGASLYVLDSRTFGAGKQAGGLPYFVTVAVAPAFTSADKVTAWCAAQFPELTSTSLTNQCFATQLKPLA